MFSFYRGECPVDPIDTSGAASSSSGAAPPPGVGTWEYPLSPVSEFNDSEADFPSSTFRRRFSSTASSLPNFNIFQPPTDLNSCKIVQLPNSAYYIPNFITADEEQQLLNKVPSPSSTLFPYPAS